MFLFTHYYTKPKFFVLIAMVSFVFRICLLKDGKSFYKKTFEISTHYLEYSGM